MCSRHSKLRADCRFSTFPALSLPNEHARELRRRLKSVPKREEQRSSCDRARAPIMPRNGLCSRARLASATRQRIGSPHESLPRGGRSMSADPAGIRIIGPSHGETLHRPKGHDRFIVPGDVPGGDFVLLAHALAPRVLGGRCPVARARMSTATSLGRSGRVGGDQRPSTAANRLQISCFAENRLATQLAQTPKGLRLEGGSFAALTPQGRRCAARCARPWRTALDRSAPLRCWVGQVPRCGTSPFPGP
jgi:hypothetical protein